MEEIKNEKFKNSHFTIWKENQAFFKKSEVVGLSLQVYQTQKSVKMQPLWAFDVGVGEISNMGSKINGIERPFIQILAPLISTVCQEFGQGLSTSAGS